MSSNQFATNKIHYQDSLSVLASSPKRPGKTISGLITSGVETVGDLLWILPKKIYEIPEIKSFKNLNCDKLFFGKGKIQKVSKRPAFGRYGKGKVKLIHITLTVKDTLSADSLELMLYNSYPHQLNHLKECSEITFLGTPTQIMPKAKSSKEKSKKEETLTVVSPKINPKVDKEDLFLIEYPNVAGIKGIYINRLIKKIPATFWKQYEKSRKPNFKGLIRSLEILHGRCKSDEQDREVALKNLIYFEFFENCLKIRARRELMAERDALSFKLSPHKESLSLSALPYDLTEDQIRCFKEVQLDLSKTTPMQRIIQGEVGSGKTTIALLSTYVVVDHGAQVAIMSPTEALAQQLFKSFYDFFINRMSSSFCIELLTGSTPAKSKNEILSNIKSGKTHIVIGTHALIQKDVLYKNLHLAIIDEQHKFGVEQRQRLQNKSTNTMVPHTLIMSATPIPRTLQLTQYGDLDISTIKSRPSGRKKVTTRIIQKDNYEKYLSFVATRVSLGEQIFIIAPLVANSDKISKVCSVESLYEKYREIFPQLTISCLHGQMNSSQKEDVLLQFKRKEINILIATTVVEVGIDIPNATVIAIYGPERFGLSSLHQLRGRVGRGELCGFCFLIVNELNDESIKRLEILEQTQDGFEIAKRDLYNRGEGDILGRGQSGRGPMYKLANITEHFQIFNQANKAVSELINNKDEQVTKALENIKSNLTSTSTV